MVIDFADFKHALRDLAEELDHSFVVEEGSLMPKTLDCLREEGFTLSMMPFRTTAENLARYFFGSLRAGFPRVPGGPVRNPQQLRHHTNLRLLR